MVWDLAAGEAEEPGVGFRAPGSVFPSLWGRQKIPESKGCSPGWSTLAEQVPVYPVLHGDSSISEGPHEDIEGKMVMFRPIGMPREAWERIQHRCLHLDWVFDYSQRGPRAPFVCPHIGL